MNINRYALREERKIQKIISKMGHIDATAIGMCNENRITSNILMPFHDNHLPISVFVPKRKKGDYKKFPVIVDIYGGGFVAGRSEQNKHFGAWCAEHGYLTFIPEYSPGPETNLFGQIGDLLNAFAAINRYVDSYDGDKSQKLHTVRESGIKVTTGIERGINNMCNYSDFIEQKALEKGTVNTFAVSVANLVKAGVLTTEKALDTLQVPDNIRAAVAEQAASLINNN